MRWLAAITCALLAPGGSTSAQLGIASAYPGDRGLGGDARVLLFEDFESGGVADLPARWENVRNAGNLSLVVDAPLGSAAAGRSLKVSGPGTGGHLYTRLGSPQPRVFVRYYVKYGSSGSYHHSGAWLGGYQPSTAWPQGGAGQRPAGDDRFTVGFEPAGSERRWDFYAYWMRMRPDGSGAFWGNTLINDRDLRVQPERWTCVEIMIAMNDPVAAANGTLAAWIDGVRIANLGPGFPTGTWSTGSAMPAISVPTTRARATAT